jgi:hypothetical protein
VIEEGFNGDQALNNTLFLLDFVIIFKFALPTSAKSAWKIANTKLNFNSQNYLS